MSTSISQGYLVIADISGYTSYLAKVEHYPQMTQMGRRSEGLKGHAGSVNCEVRPTG
jgi:hypothetical protein